MNGIRLTVRVDFGGDRALGPGKIRLLEAIRKSGSISRAGQSLDMSYRRAWLLVEDLNRCFRDGVVVKKSGGAQGGGAALTPFGEALIEKYRSIETQATVAAEKQLRDLQIALRVSSRTRKRLKRSIRVTKAR
jgi:molybdate transport system regulatory protein